MNFILFCGTPRGCCLESGTEEKACCEAGDSDHCNCKNHMLRIWVIPLSRWILHDYLGLCWWDSIPRKTRSCRTVSTRTTTRLWGRYGLFPFQTSLIDPFEVSAFNEVRMNQFQVFFCFIWALLVLWFMWPMYILRWLQGPQKRANLHALGQHILGPGRDADDFQCLCLFHLVSKIRIQQHGCPSWY